MAWKEKGSYRCTSPCCLSQGCSQASLSLGVGPVHSHGHTCVDKHTWCLSLFSSPLSPPHFQQQQQKACSFMKLPEDHFLKGLGCHGLPDAYLPPVCYFANCSHYRERLKQESWESCEHQSPPCLGNPGCHPRNSRDCVPQGELETNFSRLWSFLCRWVSESPQQPGLAASLALNIKLF